MRAHPFFWASLALVVLGTLLGAVFLREEETAWRAHNALATFAGGAKVGLKLATFAVLVLGSMLFAGEFDRGTIKVLLTRPITRTDLFLAKAVMAGGLALFFIGVVLYVALGLGCLQGELGPVWADDAYLSNTSHDQLAAHAWKAVAMSVLPVMAAAFFGVLVSNLCESSGFAVAITLTLFLLADEIALRAFRGDDVRRYFFNMYPGYAFDVLRDLSRGSSTAWKRVFEDGRPYLWVPALSSAAFAAVGYGVFRFRNITV